VNILGGNFTPYDPQAVSLLDQLRAFTGGERQAIGAAFGMVQRHAAMLAFIQIFLLLALVFLGMVPLLLVMKKPPRGARAEVSH
jgi:DHA2 family multidrug resistance protein